jgi:hypothetical protein
MPLTPEQRHLAYLLSQMGEGTEVQGIASRIVYSRTDTGEWIEGGTGTVMSDTEVAEQEPLGVE